MYLGNWQIDDFLTFVAQTFDRRGRNADAGGTINYRVYEDETTTPILTGTMAFLDPGNTEGFYSEQIQLTAANGFERGKSYNVRLHVLIDTNTVSATYHTFQIGANATEVVLKGTVDNTVTPTATVFEADDITEATADHYKDRVIIFKSGVLRDQAKDITAYALVAGRGRFTTSAFTEAPGNNDEFLIV